jgi:hypothetical protein
MSVENKIKQLLNRANGTEQLTEAAASETAVADGKPSVNTSKDNSKAGQRSGQGDSSMPRQGSSKDADMEEIMDATGKNTAAAKASKEVNPLPMKGDAKSVKTQAMEEVEQVNELSKKTLGSYIKKNVGDQRDLSYSHGADPDEYESDSASIKKADNRETGLKKAVKRLTKEEHIEHDQDDIDIKGQLDLIFGEDLSEEFRTRASSIFEAAVIARVNNEMEKVTSKLEEQTANQLVEFKEALIEKVDGYLNYVVEQYMEENELAIESGLRTEIAEDFIQGMKTLFKEHFIEVPEEKYDVLDELQAKSESLQSELDESITQSIELAKELNSLKASAILDEHTQDLADTEAEKLRKLIEGVDFDSEDLYREKVSVIKENYFPKTHKNSPEKMLVEESGTNPTSFIDSNSTMSRYVDTLSRTIKNR